MAFVIKDSLEKNTNQIKIDTVHNLIYVNEAFIIKSILEDDYWSIYKFLESLKKINFIKSSGFINKYNKVIAHTNTKEFPLFSQYTKNKNDIVITLDNKDIKFGYFVIEINNNFSQPFVESIKIKLFLSIIIAALISLLLGYVISNRILKRLELLSFNITLIKDKRFDDIKHIKTIEEDEITNLINSMELMLSNIRDMMRKEERLKGYYHNILESLNEFIVVCDDNFQIKYDNEHQLKGLILENKKFTQRIYTEITKNIHNDKFNFVIDIDIDIKHDFNKKIYLYTIIKRLDDQFACSFTDITALKLLEKQNCLTNSFEIIGEISSVVVHEIKNYLQPIKLLLEQEHIDGDDRQRIISITHKIDDIVKDFLKAGKPVDKNLSVNINIKETIEKNLFFLTEKLQNKNIILHKNIKNDLVLFMARSDLETVIINLLTNAIEASFNNGKIYINCKKGKYYMLLQFIDTGKGIDKDAIENISNPFFTTKKEGSGIGLYVVYKIVYLYSGFINVESTKGRTMFSIKLPINNKVCG